MKLLNNLKNVKLNTQKVVTGLELVAAAGAIVNVVIDIRTSMKSRAVIEDAAKNGNVWISYDGKLIEDGMNKPQVEED